MSATAKEIEVSLDGGVTWVKSPEGARILVKNAIEHDEGFNDILINVTQEGVIVDQYTAEDDVLPVTHSLYADMVD